MLYLIATPIGNLGDVSFRALETLKACDYLLCEDTRHSRRLLNHYEIQKPLKSFHLFNEAKKQQAILDDLQQGKTIGLLSDAGTPGISDPGMRLVQACKEEDLEVCPIPGACAVVVALSASGLDTTRFQFLGFLPKKKGKAKKALMQALEYPGTTICYESPYRLASTLKTLSELDPERICAVGRELTKKFEQITRDSASNLLKMYTEKAPKGEITLLISGIED